MRVRALSPSGDYQFGQGLSNFLIDSSAAVGQEVVTRLKLIQGEWFLDQTVGTPWNTQILGYGTGPTRDLAIKNVILTTPFVTALTSFSSNLNLTTRKYTVSATLETFYGTTNISTQLTV